MALFVTIAIMLVAFGGGGWAMSRSRIVRMQRNPDGTMSDDERRTMQIGIGLTGGTGGFSNPS